MIGALIKEARPKQWVKNVLVFAAPGAAGVLSEATPLGNTLLMFLAFCLTSAGTYYWNDILDVEADRTHAQASSFDRSPAEQSRCRWRAIVGTALLIGGPRWR